MIAKFFATVFYCLVLNSVAFAQEAAPIQPEGTSAPAALATPTPLPTPMPTPPVVEAPSVEPKKEKKTMASAGIGFRNTHWSHLEEPSNTNVSYDIADAKYTSVEGDINIPFLKVKLGINVQQDASSLSNIRGFAGYLGISRMSLVSEQGNFSGKAHFSGQIAPGEARDVSFQQVYRNTELDYTFFMGDEPVTIPVYLGLRYTEWNLPAEEALLSTGQSSGPTILDPDFQAKFYSLLAGMENFKSRLAYDPEHWSPGWGVMANWQIGLGLGTAKIGAATAQNVLTIYKKPVSDTSPGVFTFYTVGQLGPSYGIRVGDFRAIVGIGYEWNVLMLITTGNTDSTSTSQLDAVAYPNFLYQGVIGRFFAAF